MCASGYYNNCIFHRNIRGFIVQTGDPTGTGKGGQSIWGSTFPDEIRSTLKVSIGPSAYPLQSNLFLQFNSRGVVAMANSGNVSDSNKSQFFITYSKQPHLDGKHTIFGKVIDGADSTLDSMERVLVNNKNRPLEEIKLTHARQSSFHHSLSSSLSILCPGYNPFKSYCRCSPSRQTIKSVQHGTYDWPEYLLQKTVILLMCTA